MVSNIRPIKCQLCLHPHSALLGTKPNLQWRNKRKLKGVCVLQWQHRSILEVSRVKKLQNKTHKHHNLIKMMSSCCSLWMKAIQHGCPCTLHLVLREWYVRKYAHRTWCIMVAVYVVRGCWPGISRIC